MTKLLPLYIVLGLLITVVLAVWLYTRAMNRGQSLRKTRRALRAALAAIEEIDIATDGFSDLESPLATKIRTVVREHRAEQRSLTE